MTVPVRASSPFLRRARQFWHPVSRSCDLGDGGVAGVVVCGVPVAIWRDPDGGVGGIVDQCPHRGTRLSLGWVGQGGLACPYHAWEFARDGACTAIPQAPELPIPSRVSATPVSVVERYGLVWACVAAPGSSSANLPAFAEAADPANHTYAGVPVTWSCGATRQIENFCDVAHLSVVHDDTFGNPSQLELGRYDVTHSRDGSGPGGHDIGAVLDYAGYDRTDGTERPMAITFEYRLELPFAVWLGSTYGTGPQRRHSVLFCVTRPINDDKCCVYWVNAQPAATAPDDELLQRYETMIFEADRRLIESQVPTAAPLDVAAEVHLPFDKLAIAYRRALVDLGFGDDESDPPDGWSDATTSIDLPVRRQPVPALD